jgi:LysM repeat protein
MEIGMGMKRLSFLALVLFGLLAGPGVVPAHASAAGDYVVQPGDTLTRIAVRHGVSVSQLARANGLGWNAWVYTGQRLTIPGSTAGSSQPSSNSTYTVRPGDTLTRIAVRHGVSTSQLARANGLRRNAWVYAGQRLTIPGSTSGSSQPSNSSTYTVRPGDTLTRIAVRHGVSTSQLARANGLRWNAWVYVGQRLVIPGGQATPPASPPTQTTGGERWIDVDLTAQQLTAYEGNLPVYSALVSTGLPGTPTVVGQFRIWVKFLYDDMEGPGYYLPDVPYVMYFYRGYGLHGTYWHNNFGTPMSHGCVNLSNRDAEWLFNWASVGTKVVTHY